MKFRIKEQYLITVWTYINATDKDDAIDKIENPDSKFPLTEEIDSEWQDTDWESLERVG